MISDIKLWIGLAIIWIEVILTVAGGIWLRAALN
jgi:hypothetical protein